MCGRAADEPEAAVPALSAAGGRQLPQLGKLTHTHCKEIWIYVFPEKELRGLKFPHSCVCEWSIYSHVRSTYFPSVE